MEPLAARVAQPVFDGKRAEFGGRGGDHLQHQVAVVGMNQWRQLQRPGHLLKAKELTAAIADVFKGAVLVGAADVNQAGQVSKKFLVQGVVREEGMDFGGGYPARLGGVVDGGGFHQSGQRKFILGQAKRIVHPGELKKNFNRA
jgi:hypothetical protein